MCLQLNPLNFKKNGSVWKSLKIELDKRLNNRIEFIFPEIWNDKYYSWFQDVERIAFREELRYSFKEIEEKLHNNRIILLFILINNKPEATLLGYLFPNENNDTFFLDTIAVKNYGKGIGSLILKWIIRWLKKEKYRFLRVETEEIDEKKILLYKFYENLGFVLKARDEKGNLTMILKL